MIRLTICQITERVEGIGRNSVVMICALLMVLGVAWLLISLGKLTDFKPAAPDSNWQVLVIVNNRLMKLLGVLW